MSKKCLDVAQIAAMNRIELLELWPEFFGTPVPRQASQEFLRMALGWQFQAKKYGVVTSRLDRRLRQIAESVAEGKTPRALDRRSSARLGAIFVRTWRDRSYTVTVSDKGYVLEGVTYRSLSEVARKITGTRWNGPSFFGLRSAATKKKESVRGK